MAEKAARKAIESTYTGVCTVYEYISKRNAETKLMERTLEKVLEGEPCKLSYGNSPSAQKDGKSVRVDQGIKLFLAPEKSIRPGSKLEITQNHKTECYKRSGKAKIYASHQEIELSLYEETT